MVDMCIWWDIEVFCEGKCAKENTDERFVDTEPLPELVTHSNVTIVPLPSAPRLLQTNNKYLFLAFGPVKVLLQAWYLWQTLGYSIPPSKWMLVQVSYTLRTASPSKRLLNKI